MNEKVVTCNTHGVIAMSNDVFDEVSCDMRYRIDKMKDGRKKFEASLRFAEYCCSCGQYDTAYCYYAAVLEKTVADNKIIDKYKDLAHKAYQGLICCNSSNDECTWEITSDILAGYREIFEEE